MNSDLTKNVGDADFAGLLLGWRKTGLKWVPNNADSDNPASVKIATDMLEILNENFEEKYIPPQTSMGRPLEQSVSRDLKKCVPLLDPSRHWIIQTESTQISSFVQYEHLKRVHELVTASPELRTTLGMDYQIKPDVTVALPPRNFGEAPFLHAVISCKWTIRSDRVQNIRHEFNQMIRHRRERLPHLMTVTAEPLPSRLASIARGTGEVDAVYHIAFDALDAAVRNNRGLSDEQNAAWKEVTQQGRVRPYSDLARTIALW
jgi:hypothetical protein